MLNEWIDISIELSKVPADLYSGARKILRNRSFTFEEIEDDLVMPDAGYTKMKMTKLIKLYKHRESIDMAKTLWERRKGLKKYGSVNFHCFNHLLKNDLEKKSKRASVMGPCIQAVSLSWVKNKRENPFTAVDLFYRTTELFKKFPADLVFIRDELLTEFDFEGCPVEELNFHFANITCHPMYWITLVPNLEDPISDLEEIRRVDPYFFEWIVKWSSRYICPEHHRGIAKFEQAKRVQKHAKEQIPENVMAPLIEYFNEHHPGYRNEYKDPDEGD